jgi:hypothetical protein
MNSAGSFVRSQSRMIARLDGWNMIANRAGARRESKIARPRTAESVRKIVTRLAIPAIL